MVWCVAPVLSFSLYLFLLLPRSLFHLPVKVSLHFFPHLFVLLLHPGRYSSGIGAEVSVAHPIPVTILPTKNHLPGKNYFLPDPYTISCCTGSICLNSFHYHYPGTLLHY